ncbi:hypothetical protein Cylst_5203 [Cylindrospermum stagnale PCC 7417]|uniref:KOW domain-containing protein n=1 Tax=Cylindrospermum stagnale PCC 7417 TaxID=56107 RepID=K9X559_9NOST|nr:hypothetical protein Cylst_5203 [Cylindrospermum stagnale PCC 7417]
MLQKGEVLNPVILSGWYSLPETWCDPSESRAATELLESRDKHLEIFSIQESQPSPLPESSILTQSPQLENKQRFRAVTVRQPRASLIGIHKFFECRSKPTNYRGKILIHAGAKYSDTKKLYQKFADLLPPLEKLPFKAVVAVANLVDCLPITPELIAQQSELEIRCGDWQVGMYAWKLENVQILSVPVFAAGKEGMWNLEIPAYRLALQPVTQESLKTAEFIINPQEQIGRVQHHSPNLFSLVWADGEIDSYRWERDETLIQELAIAPSDLAQKLTSACTNKPSPFSEGDPIRVKKRGKLKGKFGTITKVFQAKREVLVKFDGCFYNIGFQFGDVEKIDLPAEASAYSVEIQAGESKPTAPLDTGTIAPQAFLGDREADRSSSRVQKPDLRTRCRILPTSSHQKYKNQQGYVCGYHTADSSELWVKLDNHNKSLRVFPDEVEFLGEMQPNFQSGDRISYQDKLAIFFSYNGATKEALIKLHNEAECISVPIVAIQKENKLPSLISTLDKSKASGHLYKYIENKKLKDGCIVSYPKVEIRDSDNITHWRWGYQWEYKDEDGRWRNKSIACPVSLVPLVKQMIERNHPVVKIREFIESSKPKKAKEKV